ncbi:MAG: hypothetical protein QXH03_02680 [Candidatus Bathyarchaeia archaeon]
MKRVLVRVEKEILDELREIFKETQGLTYSATVDFFLRKILEENRHGKGGKTD